MRDPSRGSAKDVDRIALLAHQIKTPLSTISALAQGLMRRADKLGAKEVHERAKTIWYASLRLQELIETILSDTRSKSGAITLRFVPFSLERLLRRICRETRKLQPERPLSLELKLPARLVGDPVLLEQVFSILLSNAMKYSPIHAPISVIGFTQDGTVVVEVRDRGIGVMAADVPFLRQPFFRGSNVANVAGTGLGLSLATQILLMHGGTLAIEAGEDIGTVARVVLPDARAEDRPSG